MTQQFRHETVQVDFEDGVAWVTLNRPDKRNAMNPTLNREMLQVLDALEGDDRCGVLVLTGAGESFSAGMDLKEYFRANDEKPRAATLSARREFGARQHHRRQHQRHRIRRLHAVHLVRDQPSSH